VGKVTDINDKKGAKPEAPEEPETLVEAMARAAAVLGEVPDPPPEVQALLHTMSREDLSQFALSKAVPIAKRLLIMLNSAMDRCKNCHGDKVNPCQECAAEVFGIQLISTELIMLSKCMQIASGPGSTIAAQRAAEQAQAEEHAKTCPECRAELAMRQTAKPMVGGAQIIIPDGDDGPEPKP
jgi:hypothetical protein